MIILTKIEVILTYVKLIIHFKYGQLKMFGGLCEMSKINLFRGELLNFFWTRQLVVCVQSMCLTISHILG